MHFTPVHRRPEACGISANQLRVLPRSRSTARDRTDAFEVPWRGCCAQAARTAHRDLAQVPAAPGVAVRRCLMVGMHARAGNAGAPQRYQPPVAWPRLKGSFELGIERLCIRKPRICGCEARVACQTAALDRAAE